MKTSLAAPALAVGLLTLSLAACSGAPGSVEDLVSSIEGAGYSCGEPYEEHSADYTDCGPLEGVWYEDEEAELMAHETTDAMLSDHRQTKFLLRGKQWWIIGDESSVSKIADSMGEDYESIGYFLPSGIDWRPPSS